MLRSLRLGSLFGIGVFIHWTFWLMPLFVFVSAFTSEGIREGLLSLAVILSLFGCVVLHEFGHALAARRYGIGTRDITLYPIGGVARLLRISEKPAEELVIAVAGPMVNFAIAALLAGAMVLFRMPLALDISTTPFLDNYLLRLLWVNVFLGVFNLLPAFPMDGGRVLRALLAMVTTRLRATRLAAGLGVLMAGLFVFLGLIYMPLQGYPINPMLAVLGVFIFVLGQQELQMVRASEDVRPVPAARPATPVWMVPVEQLLGPRDWPEDPLFTGHTWHPERRLRVEWRDGRPVGAAFVWGADG